MKKQKVLYYSHSGDVSGAEISLLLTIIHMKRVETLLVAPAGELLERANEQGIPTREIRSFRARMARNPLVILKGFIGTWSAGRQLRRVIQEERPDIVHANSIRAGLIAAMALRKTETKLFWHVRDHLPNNLVGRVIRRIASVRADHVFAISNAIQKNFATLPKLQSKTSRVYNAVDINRAEGASIRDEFGVPQSRYVVGVVGQIAPWKRQLDAIHAFAKLLKQAPDSELWIVGEPKFRRENIEYEDLLKIEVSSLNLTSHVRFLGFRADVMNVMSSIDVLLLPSENEPFGRVLIEAMLAGKPIVGTNAGGVPEIVVDHESGYLVDIGDVDKMAEFLGYIHQHEAARRSLGELGRSRVSQVFSVEQMVETLALAYGAGVAPLKGVI